MKKHIFIALMALISLSSCSKDDPSPETDQEEVNAARLIITPVEKQTLENKTVYIPLADGEVTELKFQAPDYTPEEGSHVHLHVGESYKLELKTTDFMGRASEQTFLNRPDIHQAFLLGASDELLSFEYADAKNVGITAYITVKKASPSFILNYIMRHLRAQVKQNISAQDWNNPNYRQFTGDNDLDLKFEVHLVEPDGHDEHHDH